MRDRLRILVVHPEVPMRDLNSLSVRLHELLSLMVCEGHSVTLLARSAPPAQERHARELESRGIEVIRGDPERAAEAGWPVTGRALDIVATMCDGRWDVVWLSLVEVVEQYTRLVRAYAPMARVVADTGDVNWVREARGAELAGDSSALAAAHRTRAREAAAYSAVDAVVAVSDTDAKALGELAPEIPTAVISNIHSPTPAGPCWQERNGLLFVGYYGHLPNVDGVLDFYAEAWPRICAELPDCMLTLVGGSPPPAIAALAGDRVVVTGRVPSVRPYIDAARVAIAPLRFGAGVKGKVGEALAASLPVVGTSIAFEGMELEDDRHMLLANDPAEFADAVVRLHTDADLWTRLSVGGRAQIESRLGPEAARQGLRQLLSQITGAIWLGTEASIAPYLGAHAATDHATLVVPIPVQTDAQALAVERITSEIRTLGYDDTQIPDINLVPADQPPALPSRAGMAPSGDQWVATRRRATRPHAAIVVLAPDDEVLARAQLDTLAASISGEQVQVLLAADALSTETVTALKRAGSGAKLISSDRPLGRRGILQRAVAASEADSVIVLDALAHPGPAFVSPLLAALSVGASLAAPRVNGAYGLSFGHGGELMPGDNTGPPDAVALDCVAARRETWLGLPHDFPPREGQFEAQLAQWAHLHGHVMVAADAHVRRLTGPAATVVICSHNRGHQIDAVVSSVLADGLHGEIVLVDNASTDDTSAIGAELVRRHPGTVRVVDEPRPGLSHARNAGLAAARHELIVYLDDDARPAPGWLAHLTTGLARAGVVNAGGPICPLWPASRQSGWPPPGTERLFAMLDLGDRERDIAPPDHVYGGNWAARRSALRAIDGFDPAFGVSPNTRLGGEEIVAAEALHRRALGVTRWLPRAAVGHIVGESGMDERAMILRSLLGGVERARRGTPEAPERLLAHATQCAQTLLSACQLSGRMELEEAADRLSSWPAGLLQQTLAADLLGEAAGYVAIAGAPELNVGELSLRIRPEHARGILTPR